jgi:hypothetical protein
VLLKKQIFWDVILCWWVRVVSSALKDHSAFIFRVKRSILDCFTHPRKLDALKFHSIYVASIFYICVVFFIYLCVCVCARACVCVLYFTLLYFNIVKSEGTASNKVYRVLYELQLSALCFS